MLNVLYTDSIWLHVVFYENKEENIKIENRKLQWRIIRKKPIKSAEFLSVFTVLERVTER